MQRIQVTERPNKAARLEARGLSFHAWDNYWKESAAYQFTAAQVDRIEAATNELLHMFEEAGDYVVKSSALMSKLGIPVEFHDAVRATWESEEPTLYGRFDFAYNGEGWPKLLEFNADTPTSLLESAVSQWDWLEDTRPNDDQFNSIHDKLVERWKHIMVKMGPGKKRIHFASADENEEDWVCVHYLMDTAAQAGYDVKHVYLSGIGYDHNSMYFVDGDDEKIEVLFKLYPLECMMREEFGKHLIETHTLLVEPLWKSLFSTKAMLPILWELYPNHRLLLPAYFDEPGMPLTSYAKKPIYSREGANIVLVRDGNVISKGADEGYGAEGHICQQLIELEEFDGFYPIIGSWVVGDEAAGMCIREDSNRITTNMSNFVPHFFK